MIVDLRSDTVTLPTEEMREAMRQAELGDDVYHEDPTLNKLEALAAERMGKEGAVYVPSGCMGNASAVIAHTHLQGALVVERRAHINTTEKPCMERLVRVKAVVIDEPSGILDPDVVDRTLSEARASGQDVRLLCLENTHNLAGGIPVPLVRMGALSEVARKHGIKVHLDGARIFNAATALKVDVKDIARHVDSVMFCVSKGLSAPVGSLVAGTREFIKEARVARQMLGGQMRQAGVLAAAALVALTKMPGRLHEDHENARLLAEAMAKMPGLRIELARVQTNIFFAWAESQAKAERLVALAEAEGVKFRSFGGGMMRLVTHKDVSREGILYAIEVIARCMTAVNQMN
jgi:threonine aldolase